MIAVVTLGVDEHAKHCSIYSFLHCIFNHSECTRLCSKPTVICCCMAYIYSCNTLALITCGSWVICINLIAQLYFIICGG